MRLKTEITGEVDEQGRLVLPAEVAEQFGLRPGAAVRANLDKNGLTLYRPVTQLAKIYIEVTSKCNLTCRTCIRNIWEEPLGLMQPETFEAIFSGLKEVHPPPTVFFGGFGEPMSHPRLLEWLGRVKELGCRVEMITNGTLLNDERSRRLMELGIDTLWVSVDGVTPDSYENVRPGAALPEVLRNISHFAALRPVHPYFFPQPEIGIAFVAMKQNIAELTPLIQLSKQLGAAHYIITNVLAYTEEMRHEVLYTGAMNEITFRASPVGPHINLPRIDLNELTIKPIQRMVQVGYHLSINDLPVAPTGDRCPFIMAGATAIGWDGGVSPCLALVHNHFSYLDKTRRKLRRYMVGNITEHSLLDLWNDPEYVAFRDRVQAFDFPPCPACGGCNKLESNLEDCFGNPFPTCGGCLWAQGIVQCP